MSLIPTIFSSSDPGAPQLTGQVGSFLSLVRALLVTGYGTAPNAKAGLGWTEEFTGTNKAVFRGNPVSGTGYRTRIDDTNAQYVLVRAYDSMSDVDTGTNPVPLPAQLTSGAMWPKSATANSTARAWWAIGNERSLYLFVDVQGLGLTEAVPYFFGDIKSFRPGDAHHYMLANNAMSAAWSGINNVVHSYWFYGQAANGWSLTPSITIASGFLARNHAQVPGSVYASNINTENSNQAGAYGGNSQQVPYPCPVNNGLLYSRMVVLEASQAPRGYLPGAIAPFHNRPAEDLAELASPDGLPVGTILVAKRFRALQPSSSNGQGEVLFDITNEW